MKRVEQDAVAFRPHGEKIFSYARRATSSGKGKTREDQPVDEDSEDAVVYEVYKVRAPKHLTSLLFPILWFPFSQLGQRQGSDHTTVRCSCLYFYISKEDRIFSRTKINGNSLYCAPPCFPPGSDHNLTLGLGTNDVDDEMQVVLRRITSRDIQLFIHSIVGQTKSG